MEISEVPTVAVEFTQAIAKPRPGVIGVLLGVVAVSVAAQIMVPIPGSIVPATLQGLAVLLVGGVLGPVGGLMALLIYLAAGAAGLPVFAPMGLPGISRLLGPTSGYLLAFPVAAMVTGALARRHSYLRCFAACLLGMVIIHLGGIAMLSIMSGGLTLPIKATVPLALVDLVKVVLAAIVITHLRSHPSFAS
ncbi:MAG: biotin transporter BioY [Gemmatimonadota bacterium]